MKKTGLFALLLFFLLIKLEAQQAEYIYHNDIDSPPSTYGGNEELKRLWHDHLVYPSEDLKAKKEGSVGVDFIVNAEGNSSNFKVTQTLSPTADKEAIHLIRLLEWVPARKEGKNVSVYQHLDVDFSTAKYKKYIRQRGFDSLPFKDYPADTSCTIYESADIAPEFNIKGKSFSEFVYGNLQYPELALRQNIEGDVIMTFIIEPDGLTSNIKIQGKGITKDCDAEALRVISLTQWKPAVKNKHYIRYRMYFTMQFRIHNNNFKDNNTGRQTGWGQ